MFFFALGTSPALLLIGLSSIKFLSKPHLSDKFLKIAGVLVIFFAIYNINAQLNVLGLASLNELFSTAQKQEQDGFAPIVKGKQVIKMDALSFGYDMSLNPPKFLFLRTRGDGLHRSWLHPVYDGELTQTRDTVARVN